MAAAGERPTGTVTFLFSDIEGSTRLLQRLGALYAQALAEHQRLLREAFEAHGGHEIDTQGDSFFVAFRRAKNAVAAAIDGQRALAEYEWPDGSELRVRMGIHTGEPAEDGNRYVGLGVHRAARIGAAALGGQVLVSETTRSLLRDDPLPDVTLRDLGAVHLKDIDEPERLFEVNAPGLAAIGLKTSTGSRRRLVGGAVVAAVVVAATLGVLLSRGGGASAAHTVEPNQVGVIDTKHGRISGAIGVGAAPNGVAAGDGAVWVANTDSNSVARLDPSSRTVSQTIQVGGSPSGVAVSPDAVWVANSADGTVSRIDPNTNTVTEKINVGNGPTAVAYGASKVWVANSADGTVSEIDPAKVDGGVVRTLPGAVGVTALTVAFGHVWGVAPTNGGVVELSADGTSSKIPVGNDPHAITHAAGSIWVTNRQDNSVWRIDPTSHNVTATVTVGGAPTAIAAAGSAVWVANADAGTLSKIDTTSNSVTGTVSLANPPQGLASSGSDLYVSVRSNGAANRGGTLRVDLGQGAPDFLDPAFAYTPTSWSALTMTSDGLVGFRRVGGPEGAQLVPDLATAIPVPTEGGRTYTFTLRRGIRYSNGRLVEPDDIKAAIERLLSASHPTPTTRNYFSTTIVGAGHCAPGRPCRLPGIVTNRDARTVTFHLTAPDPDFLSKLALPSADAAPPGTPARVQHTLVGTGPYRIASYSAKNRTIRLVRNPSFVEWSQDAQPQGFPDTIEITWPPDSAQPTQADSQLTKSVLDGRADVGIFTASPPVPKQTLERLKTLYPSQLRLILSPGTWYFFLNTRVPPFDDVRVRQAVQLAFDRAAFGRLLTPEYATTCNILPPGYSGYQRGCPYAGSETSRLERAKALVRASGRAGARIVVWTPAPLAFEGRYMISLLDKLGFRASAHTTAEGDFEAYFLKGILDPGKRVQTGYIGWSADYPSSLAFFQQQLSCAGFTMDPETNQNVSGFCDRRIDAEIEHASQVQVLDPPRATLLWQKIERDLLAAAPMVPTYNGRAIVFLSKRVGNFQYNPQWGTLLDQLWVRGASSG